MRKKQQRFADNRESRNVIEPGKEIFERIKGKWRSEFFCNENDIPHDDLFDSIEVLKNNYLIEGDPGYGGKISLFKVTSHGFETYAQYFYPDYDEITRKVLISVVNESSMSNIELSEELKIPKIIIEFALASLESLGHIKVSRTMGGTEKVHSVSVEAKRLARQLGG